MMKQLRKIIRKELFNLYENYPVGAENDPKAPWNQLNSKITAIKKPKTDLFIVIYFGKEITILKNTKDGSKWFFFNDSVQKEDYFPYSGAEGKSVFIGKDEEGEPNFETEYDSWNLNGQIVQDYVNDNLEILSKGEGINDYESGVDLVKIDELVAHEIINTFKDEKLKDILLQP